jgi:HK97 family phage major capsid protein
VKLYEIKEKMGIVGEQLKYVENQLVDKLANPSVPMDEITNLKNEKTGLQERFDLLKEQHDKIEKEHKNRIKKQLDKSKNSVSMAETSEKRLIAAKAEFFRAAAMKRPLSEEAQNALQAIPAPTESGGENFLPTTLSNELVYEPFARNPVRQIVRLTNIKGLEVPKIAYTIDDDAFIGDADTAKELDLTGDKVVFGRNKFKVVTTVADTVLHGSDLNLVEYINNALRSGLAAKEKKVMFATTPTTGEEHMSFYSNGIKSVGTGKTFDDITAAIADLHEDFRENATVVMSYADYVKMIKELANSSVTLYNTQPEAVIGKPVVFSDMASTPVVGDFSYSQINYDGSLVYDSDKDVKAGEYNFVLTAWFDHQILLKSAFRLVGATGGGGNDSLGDEPSV